MFNLKQNININSKIVTRKISGDKITPIKILENLSGIALLETAYSDTGKGKYSIILLKEAFTIYNYKEKNYLLNPNGKKYVISGKNKSFLDILREFRNRAPMIEKNLFEFPIPLGGVGYLGYNFFSEIENIEFKNKIDERDIYNSAFIFGRNFAIFDHFHDEILVVSVQYNGEIEEIDLNKELDSIEYNINNIDKNFKDKPLTKKKSIIINNPDNKEKFIEKVKFIKDEIYKGNLLQCVLSRRLEIETNYKAIECYRYLRIKNPSPYMFYINFRKFVIFGASPEVMVKVKDNYVIERPIAGTRPRGKTLAQDIAFENELKNDIKEKAEHLMLVDLGRNDIGKVCEGGTVKVVENMVVEKYSNVMHLVSEVKGILKKGKNVDDVIKATFPAGTVTGAPKIQAIKTIDKLEDYCRGPYAGLVGYFENDFTFDSCINIRSAVYKGKKIWVQAGAGIVYDSDPEKEYEETENKMKALLIALGIEI